VDRRLDFSQFFKAHTKASWNVVAADHQEEILSVFNSQNEQISNLVLIIIECRSSSGIYQDTEIDDSLFAY
jgi:hypothetical protein